MFGLGWVVDGQCSFQAAFESSTWYIPDAYTCVLSHVRLFCDPKDCSPPASSAHGIFQVRILEWVVISYTPGNLPDPGIEPTSPALARGFFIIASPGKPMFLILAPKFALHMWPFPFYHFSSPTKQLYRIYLDSGCYWPDLLWTGQACVYKMTETNQHFY